MFSNSGIILYIEVQKWLLLFWLYLDALNPECFLSERILNGSKTRPNLKQHFSRVGPIYLWAILLMICGYTHNSEARLLNDLTNLALYSLWLLLSDGPISEYNLTTTLYSHSLSYYIGWWNPPECYHWKDRELSRCEFNSHLVFWVYLWWELDANL